MKERTKRDARAGLRIGERQIAVRPDRDVRATAFAIREVLAQPFARAVRRDIIDDDDFLFHIRQRPAYEPEHRRNEVAVVVGGNQNGEHQGPVCVAASGNAPEGPPPYSTLSG